MGSDATVTHVILFKKILPLTFSPHRLAPWALPSSHPMLLLWGAQLASLSTSTPAPPAHSRMTNSLLFLTVFFFLLLLSLLFFTLHKNCCRLSFTFTRSSGNYCRFPYVLHVKKDKKVNRQRGQLVPSSLQTKTQCSESRFHR